MKKWIWMGMLVAVWGMSGRGVWAAEKHFGYYWGYDAAGQIGVYADTMIVDNTFQVDVIKNQGMKGILIMSGAFWDCATRPCKLKTDWKTRFENMWNGNVDYPAIKDRLNNVAGIYLMDEPEMNVNYNDYVTVLDFVKARVGKPMMMVMTYEGPGILENLGKPHPDVQASWMNGNIIKIPSGVDWLGFDEYGVWNTTDRQAAYYSGKCQSVAPFGGLGMAEKLAIVERFMKSRGGKVVVIADGYTDNNVLNNKCTTLAADEDKKLVLADKYFEWCKARDVCAGVWAFLWKAEGMTGTNAMPRLEAKFKTLALEMRGGTTTVPGDWTGDGIVGIEDFGGWKEAYLKGTATLVDFGIWKEAYLAR